eukprot:SAG31_NODE_687_length_12813_cov_2.597216_6_plen_123_part_00
MVDRPGRTWRAPVREVVARLAVGAVEGTLDSVVRGLAAAALTALPTAAEPYRAHVFVVRRITRVRPVLPKRQVAVERIARARECHCSVRRCADDQRDCGNETTLRTRRGHPCWFAPETRRRG